MQDPLTSPQHFARLELDKLLRTIIHEFKRRQARLILIPDRKALDETASRLIPSRSRLMIAAATHRKIPIAAYPRDLPDVYAAIDDQVVALRNGRNVRLGTISGQFYTQYMPGSRAVRITDERTLNMTLHYVVIHGDR